MSKHLLFLLFLLSVKLSGQADSVVFKPDSAGDCIFMSYEDFRENKPVLKTTIVSDADKTRPGFIRKVLSEEVFIFTRAGKEIKRSSRSVWGFFENSAFYINYKGVFYRVPHFGAISCFVTADDYYAGGDILLAGSTPTNLRRQTYISEYMMSYRDGNVLAFSRKNTAHLIAGDSALSQEYKQLGRRAQEREKRRFVQRFNDAHKVYVLK
jgi:hypothetical protein